MNTCIKALFEFLQYTLVLGIIFPCVVYVFSCLFFLDKATGSLIKKDDNILGSAFVGQSFTKDHYFWGRPSSTPEHEYNSSSSSGSNLALTNPDFKTKLNERCLRFQSKQKCPVDLVTASSSGLDPEISIAAAEFQIPRIAEARKLTQDVVRSILMKHVKKRNIYLLDMTRVNVLKINLELDAYEH